MISVSSLVVLNFSRLCFSHSVTTKSADVGDGQSVSEVGTLLRPPYATPPRVSTCSPLILMTFSFGLVASFEE